MRKEYYMILGALSRLVDCVYNNQETMERYASETATAIEVVPSYLILGEIKNIKEDLENED